MRPWYVSPRLAMGDVKSRKDRPGELRLRVGKWRVFFCLEPPDFVRVLGIDNRGEAY